MQLIMAVLIGIGCGLLVSAVFGLFMPKYERATILGMGMLLILLGYGLGQIQ